MRLVLTSLYLSWKDWLHERTLTLCAVLALASMLAPILVLESVRTGVVFAMREKLLTDPTVLVITPYAGKARFSPDFLDKVRAQPGARFIIGRTREIATDVRFVRATTRGATSDVPAEVSVHLEPSAPGEPVLARYGLLSPTDGPKPGIVLAARAAEKLGVGQGDDLRALLGRRTHEGRLESLELSVRVSGVLPAEAGDRIVGFVPLALLEDIQDYRDDIAVPKRGMSGQARTGVRDYASFRLYARDLASVLTLSEYLAAEGVEVRTKAHEIAAIRALDQSLNRVIAILSCAVGTGFVAFTISSAKGAVRRKVRMLGLLRLFGFSRVALITYPLFQAFLTNTAGACLAFVCYGIVGTVIDGLFAAQSGGLVLCRLSAADAGLALCCVYGLSALSGVYAAYRAAAVDPAAVIREI